MILRLLPVLAGMAGCAYISDEDEAVRLDPDGDGVPIGQDCDDTDAAVGAPVTWFVDEDGDNYGLDGTETTGCEAPTSPPCRPETATTPTAACSPAPPTPGTTASTPTAPAT